jgi:hypothetical protein
VLSISSVVYGLQFLFLVRHAAEHTAMCQQLHTTKGCKLPALCAFSASTLCICSCTLLTLADARLLAAVTLGVSVCAQHAPAALGTCKWSWLLAPSHSSVPEWEAVHQVLGTSCALLSCRACPPCCFQGYEGSRVGLTACLWCSHHSHFGAQSMVLMLLLSAAAGPQPRGPPQQGGSSEVPGEPTEL